MVVNGWKLYVHPLFLQQLIRLTEQVEALARKDPAHYREHPATKLLATVNSHIRELIPRDPGAAEFRQGNTLGTDNRHWFRAKFHERYRLFYRFSTKEKVIIYAWVNDESTLSQSRREDRSISAIQSHARIRRPPQSVQELLDRAVELS